MLQWPIPTNLTELRGFLGLTGYYRKFVKSYGIIAKPLTNMLQKHKNFQWTPLAQDAFDALKVAMTNTPVLVLPDFNKPFCIETDACGTGVGAVLLQEEHPVAYYSKALSPLNQKLSIYEQEFLAIIMAIDKWRSYLLRCPFVIRMDRSSNIFFHIFGAVKTTGFQGKLVHLQAGQFRTEVQSDHFKNK